MDRSDYQDQLNSAFKVTDLTTITRVSGELNVEELVESIIGDCFDRASDVEVDLPGYRKTISFSFTVEESD